MFVFQKSEVVYISRGFEIFYRNSMYKTDSGVVIAQCKSR